jgi:hypothetical protein
MQLYERTLFLGHSTRDCEATLGGDELFVHQCSNLHPDNEYERL